MTPKAPKPPDAHSPPAPPPAPPPTSNHAARKAIESAVGRPFADPDLLTRALTHASIAEQRLDSNERMEFLGDSVLGLIVAQRIYERYPDLLEGEMTKIKSTAVSRTTCALIARQLGLDRHLILGKGMQRDSSMPPSLAAAVLESVIAAIYLDGGYAAAEGFVAPLFEPLIERAARSGHQENFKSVLQQHAQQTGLEPPAYRVLDEKGPDHAKAFKIGIEIGPRRFTASWGQSKKQAEQSAAKAALEELGLLKTADDGQVLVVRAEPDKPAGGLAHATPHRPTDRAPARPVPALVPAPQPAKKTRPAQPAPKPARKAKPAPRPAAKKPAARRPSKPQKKKR